MANDEERRERWFQESGLDSIVVAPIDLKTRVFEMLKKEATYQQAAVAPMFGKIKEIVDNSFDDPCGGVELQIWYDDDEELYFAVIEGGEVNASCNGPDLFKVLDRLHRCDEMEHVTLDENGNDIEDDDD